MRLLGRHYGLNTNAECIIDTAICFYTIHYSYRIFVELNLQRLKPHHRVFPK